MIMLIALPITMLITIGTGIVTMKCFNHYKNKNIQIEAN